MSIYRSIWKVALSIVCWIWGVGGVFVVGCLCGVMYCYNVCVLFMCLCACVDYTHSITLTPSPSLYHPHSITFTLSPSLYHPHSITLTLSPSLHHPHSHPHSITLTLSPSLYHPHSITLTRSPLPDTDSLLVVRRWKSQRYRTGPLCGCHCVELPKKKR